MRRTPADSPDRASIQNNLGAGLRDRYARTGRQADLDAAVALGGRCGDARPRARDSPVAFLLGQQRRWPGLYARAVETLLAGGRAREALELAEGTKARLQTNLMGRGELPVPATVPADLAAREQAAATRLNALDAAELAGHGRTPETRTETGAGNRGPIVTELRAVWAEIEALSPEAAEYVALRRGDRPSWAGLARLAAALPAGAALLSLFDTGERTLVFLLPGGADAPVVHAMDLSDAEAGATHGEVLFRVFIDTYSDEMLNRATWRELGRPLTQRWRALGRSLLGPLRPHLAGIDHLVIAPEGPYHQLPLHALWLSEDGDTLLDHCAVSYVPALGVLERLLRRAPADGGGSAVFGYTHADPTTEDGRRERKVFLGEAQAVAGLVGVAPVLDAAATGAALRAATADPLRLLHLSCHGYFHPGDALASGVQLAGENGGRAVYTARDFMAATAAGRPGDAQRLPDGHQRLPGRRRDGRAEPGPAVGRGAVAAARVVERQRRHNRSDDDGLLPPSVAG